MARRRRRQYDRRRVTEAVYSWFEREEARRAAWAAPGVKNVEDRIAVVP
jgi:osmotically-inducible protein OsmY